MTDHTTDHTIGTREEWLAARLELLEAEKELTRRSDELARRRQELPWVRIDKEYRFETDEGSASLQDLFRGRSQLLVYHFMFGPEYTAGCPSCSAIADGFNGFVVHLANHDVAFSAVSRAPLEKLQAYKRRMGWSFPWASSFGSDFNYDFQVTFTKEQQQSGVVEYNFRAMDTRSEARRRTDSRRLWHGRGDGFAGSAGHERVRARGRRRLPHLLGVHPRAGRPLGHVPVARPRATRAQRDQGGEGGGTTPRPGGAAATKKTKGGGGGGRGGARPTARTTPAPREGDGRGGGQRQGGQTEGKKQRTNHKPGPHDPPARTRPQQRRGERRAWGGGGKEGGGGGDPGEGDHFTQPKEELMAEEPITRTSRGRVFIGVSLDGYIARPDSDIEWLTDPPSHIEHERVVSDRPAPRLERVHRRHRSPCDGPRHLREGPWLPRPLALRRSTGCRLSTTLSSTADERITVARSVEEATKLLSENQARGVYVDGGKVIQAFLRSDLIDEITIGIAPVLIGNGIPLFGELPWRYPATPRRCSCLRGGGMTHATYDVVRAL